MTVDLRDVELPPGRTDLPLELGMGEVQVMVPEDMCVTTDGRPSAWARSTSATASRAASTSTSTTAPARARRPAAATRRRHRHRRAASSATRSSTAHGPRSCRRRRLRRVEYGTNRARVPGGGMTPRPGLRPGLADRRRDRDRARRPAAARPGRRARAQPRVHAAGACSPRSAASCSRAGSPARRASAAEASGNIRRGDRARDAARAAPPRPLDRDRRRRLRGPRAAARASTRWCCGSASWSPRSSAASASALYVLCWALMPAGEEPGARR